MLDPSEYPASVDLRNRDFVILDIPSYVAWSQKNNMPIKFSYGRVYFKEEEHAILFKLTFGL